MRKSHSKNAKYCIALFLAMFFLGGQPVEFGKEKSFFQGYLIPKPIIRIGLGINLPDVKISSASGMNIYEVKPNYRLLANDADEIFIKRDRKKLSKIIYFIPNSQQSYLSYKGRDYRGIFVLKASSKGIVIINILNLEDYLKSVVPSELCPYTFHEFEAHRAQAVAARTYAIKNLGMNEDLGFDLYDTPKSQYYKGMNAEHPMSSMAVEQTQGQVALYDGKLIDALYTSSCGGMTENVEEIFRGFPLPYLRSTECDYERQREWLVNCDNNVFPVNTNILGQNSSPDSWHANKTKKELEKRINRYYPIGELIDLIPLRRGHSKRVVELLISGSKTQIIVKGLKIRRVLGLRETLFVIYREYDKEGRITHFIFSGRGQGHGVGLCQVGAYGMALAGADYKEILKKYYHGIKISKIY